ncbi:Hypothetical protein KVN_LOCUS523 [uncultured virus]|nr:Hypothetical protein KVN_LOCUS523 [uncultured virus]
MSVATLVGTVIIGKNVMSILSSAGTDFIITTVTTTTNSIIGLLKHITAIDQPRVREITESLNKIDLEYNIQVIEQLVIEQKEKQLPLSLKMALFGVNEILEKIHLELKIIKDAIDYHSTKYFSKWRSFDCSLNIEFIKSNKLLLDNRYEKLMDFLTLHKN